MNAEIQHLDTCVSDFFRGCGGDHCAAIPVDGETTIAEVIDAMREDDWGHDEWSDVQIAAMDRAIESMVNKNLDRLKAKFDDKLEVTSDDGGDHVYAYFTIVWSD